MKLPRLLTDGAVSSPGAGSSALLDVSAEVCVVKERGREDGLDGGGEFRKPQLPEVTIVGLPVQEYGLEAG